MGNPPATPVMMVILLIIPAALAAILAKTEVAAMMLEEVEGTTTTAEMAAVAAVIANRGRLATPTMVVALLHNPRSIMTPVVSLVVLLANLKRMVMALVANLGSLRMTR
jgi:hypothetical protein